MTAIDTARSLESLMRVAAHAAHTGRDADACEARATAAMKVQFYLLRQGYWGGPPPTQAEAQAAASRAWPEGVPADVEAALF